MASSDDSTVVIQIATELKDLKSQFNKFEQDAKSSGEKAGKSLSQGIDGSLNKGLSSLKRELLSVGAAIAGAFAFRKMINEATAAENAVNELNGALRAAGLNVSQASERFQAYAASLQNITTVSDDAIIASASVLVSIGKLSGDGLERATKASLDLSAGLGVSLETAMDMVAKAAQGSTGAFQRYGLEVKEGASDSVKFAAALGFIETRFAGLSENKVNTFSGAMSQMGNRFNDVIETLGKMITQSPVVIALVKMLGEAFLTMNTALTKFAGSGDVVGGLIETLANFGSTVVKYAVAPLELLYNIGVITFNTLKVAGQSLLVLFLDIGNVIFQALVYPMQKVAEGAAIVARVFGANGLAGDADTAAKAFGNFRDASTMARDAARETLDEFGRDLVASNDKIFDFSTSDAADKLVEKIKTVIAAAKEKLAGSPDPGGAPDTEEALAPMITVGEGFENISQGITDRIADLRKNAVANFQEIGKQAFNTMAGGVGNAFAAMGKAIAKGQNGLKAFAGAMVSALGQAAVQMGQMFILQGAAYLWAGNAAQGVPLMAAGAGLAAIGGVMSALGGGGESASSGGGVAASGGTLGGSDMMTKPTETQKETSVQVVVQGNILDRRETGLAIAETLNEFFNTSDGRLVRTS